MFPNGCGHVSTPGVKPTAEEMSAEGVLLEDDEPEQHVEEPCGAIITDANKNKSSQNTKHVSFHLNADVATPAVRCCKIVGGNPSKIVLHGPSCNSHVRVVGSHAHPYTGKSRRAMDDR